MTKAEAIRILEQSCPKRPQKLWSIKRKEAVKMAIEALQRGLENVNADSCSEKPNRSDTIYRQDAIDAVKRNTFRLTFAEEQNCEGHVAWSAEAVYSDVMEGELLELPSANPDLSGYSDRLWKSAYDHGYDRCKQDAIEAVDVKCLHRGIVKGIQDIIEDLPSAQPELYCAPQPDLSDDGTFMMTVPHGILSDVKRVLVDEVGTKNCKMMYQDEPERKKGEWIHKPDIYLDEQTWECSECGEPWIFIEGTPSENNANFCPNCGAEMRGEENETD